MKYLDPEEIKKNRDELVLKQRRMSWDIRSGKILGLAEKYLPYRSGLILDCGSADGSLLLQFSEVGYQNLTGVDIDDYRSGSAKKFNFVKSDLCFDKLPWPDNNFDGVIASQLIEHLENPYYFGREVFRILKPGGIFIISTPNPFHILNRLLFLRRGDIYHFLENDNHITFFTRSIFKKTFLKKFKLLTVSYDKPEFKYHWLNRPWLKKLLSANQWFSRYIYYVLKK